MGPSAFENCTGLSSIVLPDGLLTVQTSLFKGCANLASVGIPARVIRIAGSAFSGCLSLNSVTIPDNILTIESSAFYNCTSLTGAITIPASVVGTLGTNAFRNTGITQVTFQAKSNPLTIGGNAFGSCDDLTTVVFGDTKVTISADSCFPSGSSLRTAYSSGGAGTYTLSVGTWSKSSS
jgi:hypothetical protein